MIIDNFYIKGVTVFKTEAQSPLIIDADTVLASPVAFSKYGDKVDAIINMDAALTINGGFWGQMGASYGARNGTVNGAGIAVQFK